MGEEEKGGAVGRSPCCSRGIEARGDYARRIYSRFESLSLVLSPLSLSLLLSLVGFRDETIALAQELRAKVSGGEAVGEQTKPRRLKVVRARRYVPLRRDAGFPFLAPSFFDASVLKRSFETESCRLAD